MKNKLFSIFTALAMVLGILVAPFTSANAAEEAKYENSTNKINIHKILFKEEKAYTDWKPEDHKTSSEITNIKEYFGDKAEEIAGVAYDIYKEEKATDTNKANGQTLNTEFNTSEFKEDKYYSIVKTDKSNRNLGELLTTASGTGDVELEDGSYVIVENADRTTYQDPATGQTVSKQGKAIPVRITLPAALPVENTSGVLHLYPKNTTVDSPDTEKNFTDKIDIKDANNTTKQEEKNNEENYRVSGVGQPVPYTVETVFKPNTNFKNAYWNDQMTKGLTFTQEDLDAMKIYVNGVDKTDSFGKELDGNGYKVVLNDMTLVNGQKENVTVRLEYTAKLNEDSKVEIPESNDVTFHYGNNPIHGNTPKPTKPKENGELEVEKTWADGVPAAGEWASFTLKNANTGKIIGTVKFETKDNNGNLETTTTYTANAEYKPIGNEKNLAGPEKETVSGNKWTFKWTGLDKDLEYKVEEDNNMNETAKFTKGADGKIIIENKKDKNPTPKNPQEPKVVRYGKKFVKADEADGKRLNGAKFVVKHEKENKYLVNKTAEELAKEKSDYDKAVAEYDAIYKNPDAKQDQLDAKFEEVKAKAEALNNKYKWADANDKKAAAKLANVVTLEPKENGKFEITDLQLGKYNLEEIAAPKDYAVRDGVIPFEVTKTSYNKDDSKIGVVYEGTDNVVNEAKDADAQRVDNRKLTIPQTGGIGSLIFVVAGLAIMAGAYVAYRKNQARA
ncbi:fimbrial isopeptide formation D2 domain [Anaerococcus prevotii]|uniref:LPXTG-motif cell wall anchor domain protein n=1 Tax=Anaerococcus prevotii (strain ATCC 9321 / DSM 20548 / JCM 6508 / NCTC 11806 / PC1) TaxID=525919 RepID=C7RE61_ANAPD|nr:pilin N-terminal domain-containing protein [Anaerococcus prevotii]ACV29474.1 LPXTG-motif cell wall anchor domain protein [Anaerococcus prevotii DSM 20548]SUU95148.1 fimbrial isopeptide formation D2 domain [Anaerococcus prevotii]